MSIFSFFKPPKIKRFNPPVRYYDPAKEDLDKRVAAKKREMRNLGDANFELTYAERVAQAYKEHRKATVRTGTLQTMFVALFLLLFFAYLQYGNSAFYLFLTVAPIYFLLRKAKLV